MRRLFQHRGKSKKLTMSGLINQNFLIVLVDSRHVNFARHHHEGLVAGISKFIDSLTGCEFHELNLARQNCRFLFVQQRKERDMPQHFRVTSHRLPPLLFLNMRTHVELPGPEHLIGSALTTTRLIVKIRLRRLGRL